MSKPIFATVAEALVALSRDRLASVWRAGGPENSLAKDGPVTA